jgi:hypothetical protein
LQLSLCAWALWPPTAPVGVPEKMPIGVAVPFPTKPLRMLCFNGPFCGQHSCWANATLDHITCAPRPNVAWLPPFCSRISRRVANVHTVPYGMSIPYGMQDFKLWNQTQEPSLGLWQVIPQSERCFWLRTCTRHLKCLGQILNQSNSCFVSIVLLKLGIRCFVLSSPLSLLCLEACTRINSPQLGCNAPWVYAQKV